LSETQSESGRPLFPWTQEQIRQYTLAHTRRVEVRGRYPTRIFVWLLLRFVRNLTWRGAYRLGALIGLAMHRLNIRRSVAMTNLDIVYGEAKTPAEKDEIYRQSLLNFGRQAVNYLRMPLMDDAFWQNDFRLINEDVLRRAYNRGKGVILLYMHFGPWEMPGGRISHAGYPLAVVAKRIKNPVIDKLVVQARAAMTLGTIGHRDSMERIREGLRRGEGIIMVLDQNMKRNQGVFVEWLGRPASTVRSVAWLARETGAPVITGWARQRGPKDFEMTMTEEIPWEAHPDPAEELLVNTRNYVRAVEQHIRAMPEEWFWLHRRWKLQPEGLANPYDG